MSVLAILLLPLAAAVLVSIPAGKRWPSLVTLAACLAVLILVAHLALHASSGLPLHPTANTGRFRWIVVDGLGALILLLVATVSVTAALFSIGYLGRPSLPPRKLRLYYLNYNLFIFSMLAIPVLSEPTLVWIVVELTTLCSALLVSFDNTHAALEAAWKYVVLSLMGAGVALFGFLVLFAAMQAAGGDNFSWQGLAAVAPNMPPLLLRTAFVLILVGLGTKVGLAPMHTWLPDAHSQAPAPVCALLSGVETTTILYVILRLLPIMRAAPGSGMDAWMVAFGLISAGTAAFLLLQVRDYKRLFAFSTVEHMGIICVAAGLGGATGNYAAMLQIVAHGLTKSFCFFAAGATLLALETREIGSVRGLLRTSPVAGAALLGGALAIGGAPPFALFPSEFSVFRAGLQAQHYVATALLVAFIAIAFLGVLLHVNRMAFGRPPQSAPARVHLPLSCHVALALAAIPVFLLGIFQPAALHRLLCVAAGNLGGVLHP